MTLPELYHAHHTLDEEDLPFWMELAGTQGEPILELGCGTGRVLLRLASQGYQTYGIDHQMGMLSVLQRNLPNSLRYPPRVFQADMSTFRLAARFPLILLPCNTMSTLSSSQRYQTLKNISRHLAEGGLFAASIPNPAILAKLPEIGESEMEDIFYHPVDGEPVQVSSSWKRTPEKFILDWHYDHLLSDGTVERISMKTFHELHSVQAYSQQVLEAGLKVETSYGDFDRSPYNSQSPYFILIAILA
jgi:SAM-dependent methyltransferase